jgi:predicted amidohydrolase YtcJ
VSVSPRRLGVLLSLLLPGCATAPPAVNPADLVFWGGPIHTADDARPTAEAVAVDEGRIVYVGARRGAQALVGRGTQVVDLRGASLYPGFTDAHAHLRGIGERELTLNLEGVGSVAELQQRLRARVEQAGPNAVVTGRGWIETHWPEKRFPTAADLDQAAPDNPVLLVRADGHALVANSAALRRAGIDAATRAPSGGEILKDASGKPTGVLVDAAMNLVAALQAEPSAEERTRALRKAHDVYSAYGWTGIHNMSVDWADVEAIEALAASGELPGLRVYNSVTPEAGERLLREGPRNAADGRAVTRAIKFYVDGALGSRGAALFEPYSDAPHTRGLVQLTPEQILPVYEQALRRGIQVTTHAIGDRGNSLVLDWYERAFRAAPEAQRMVKEPRWRIEHAQVVRPGEIERFDRLDVIASMQPSHAIGDLHFAPARLGDARLEGAYAWRAMLATGARVVGGSDAPVERGDPLIEFYAAVARKDLKGFSGRGWHPEQALDRAAALKLFTAWPAYAAFAENEVGTITVGKRADLTVFDIDLMRAPEAQIPKGRALLTAVDGKPAHRDATWWPAR